MELRSSIIADFQNGDIGYSRGPVIYILDKNTLKIKQKIRETTYPRSTYDAIRFNIYNDN